LHPTDRDTGAAGRIANFLAACALQPARVALVCSSETKRIDPIDPKSWAPVVWYVLSPCGPSSSTAEAGSDARRVARHSPRHRSQAGAVHAPREFGRGDACAD